MKKKWKNLQPWIDYFQMLQEYEKKGFLEMKPEKGEAYVTRAALLTLTGAWSDTGGFPGQRKAETLLLRKLPVVIRRVRAYAAWKSRSGEKFLGRPFALNIVKEDEPHDLLHTVVLTRERRWWKLWMKTDVFDVVTYE